MDDPGVVLACDTDLQPSAYSSTLPLEGKAYVCMCFDVGHGIGVTQLQMQGKIILFLMVILIIQQVVVDGIMVPRIEPVKRVG